MNEFFTKKQLSPICLQWKDSISEGLKCRLSKIEVRVVHREDTDQNIVDELSRISHPSKRQRKNVAFRNPDFLWP